MESNDIYIPDVYQLKVLLLGISPTIWRRILVRSDSTITDLHYILQVLMDWSDDYLHQFIIRGKKYGIPRECGISFYDNPDQVRLRQFNFRLKEKFIYEYNFYSEWRIQIRVEKYLQFDDRKIYPVCIGGSKQAPYEECQGPWAFMALRQKYSKWYILDRVMDMIDGNDDDEEICNEISEFKYWLNIDRFDRRTTNKRLTQYASGNDPWLV